MSVSEGGSYVIDASSLIEAENRYYSIKVFPVFWNKLIELNEHGMICSIDQIREELIVQDGALVKWVDESAHHTFFQSTDTEEVINTYSQIVEWINEHEQYREAAKSDFLAGADAWLIAFAHVHDKKVVTQEVPAPRSETKIKIPDVCREFDVICVNTFEMLSELGVVFN